jgi:hypothetical protein
MTGLPHLARLAAVELGLLHMAAASHAAEASSALAGKSIILNWTDTRTVRTESGRERTFELSLTIKLYVSYKGRVFSVFDRASSKGNNRSDAGISGERNRPLHWRFEGRDLVVDEPFVSGARHVSISFGENFSTCGIRVTYGKKSGEPIRTHPLHGPGILEILDVAVTATSCSVQQGNLFAL